MRRVPPGCESETFGLDDIAVVKAAERIRSKVEGDVGTAIILGSGLAGIAETVEKSATLPYRSIPGFALASAPGHAGTLILGEVWGEKVAVMSGRPHLYEGYDRTAVAFPIRVLRELGVHTLILTNAAGAINVQFCGGDLMLITDHIDLTFTTSPITAQSSAVPLLREHFRYDGEPCSVLAREVLRLGVDLWQGTYAALTGPSYETEAEMRMLERIGADAVGMSTVVEAIEAFRVGMRVVGVSCIANPRRRTARLTHADVERTVQSVTPALGHLICVLVSSTRQMRPLT
jgi:purine-nucleoside phosphorylase